MSKSLKKPATKAELLAAIAEIERDPANQNVPGCFYPLKARARNRVDSMRRQIVAIIREERIAAGVDPETMDAGYSGRNSNRR